MITLSRLENDSTDPWPRFISFLPNPRSTYTGGSQRLSRTKLLNGLVHITANPYCHGDRDMRFTFQIKTEAERKTLSGMHESGELIEIATPEGYFFGYMQELGGLETGAVSMKIMVESKQGVDDVVVDVPVPPEPPAGEWASYFDNTYWQPLDGKAAWVGGQWEMVEDAPAWFGIQLNAIGSWMAGFRPTLIRLTFSYPGGDPGMLLMAAGPTGLAWPNPCISGDEYEIDFSSGLDISYLQLPDGSWSSKGFLTNIEFFGVPV